MVRGTRIRHPCGVQPIGNSLFCKTVDCRHALGKLSALDDELILKILGCLDARGLANLGCTCKAAYCFANHEELWKALTMEAFGGSFNFAGSWRATFLRVSSLYPGAQTQPALVVGNMFSDLLYQPFHCATANIRKEWIQADDIERTSDLSLEDFRERYEKPAKPVIITDVVSKWPAFRKWTADYLREHFQGQKVTVGDMPMAFEDFLTYSRCTQDEMPLYLFDKHFGKTTQLANDYETPEYFSEDLFSVLREDRPDYRWLIMGGKRSGSSFHKDPNSTSAWNAVISGAKKWILYPPHVLPPGVKASEDGTEVATSVSLIEWFLNFYEQTKEGPISRQPLECVVRAGELVFVPRGWWHLVLNLKEGIAVTQNYVSSINLPHVLKVLETKSEDLISGCSVEKRRGLHDKFLSALKEQHPEVLEMRGTKRKAANIAACFQKDTSSAFKFSFS